MLVKLLQVRAGWLGRQWAKRVGAQVAHDVCQRIDDDLLMPLEQFAASRVALNNAVRVSDDCLGAD